MSLFKAKDVWLTDCGKDEVFDSNSMVVADLEGKGFEQIIVGSHDGYLRIFQCDADDVTDISFTASNLVIEIQLEHPILQVAVGRLTSGIKTFHIGILHPLKIAVYALSVTEGSAVHGNEAKLVLMYEHVLLKSTYQLIVGPFGGVKDRDFLCVQTLDGMLLFFEQETFVLDRSLPLFLIPAPICYVPQTDSFVVLNADWVLESYCYQTLGDATDRKLHPSWRYNLGEPIIDVQNISISAKESAIFVLGERNIFCFRETGVLRFTKRLQYSAVCFHAFYLEEGEKLMEMIVSDTGTLLIYENTILKWAAELSMSAVAVARVNFKALKGLVVILSEIGELRCSCLGTEPSLFVAPPLRKNAATYKQSEKKLKSLKEEIKQLSSVDGSKNLANSSRDEHELMAHVKCTFRGGSNSCQIASELTSVSPLNEVQVSYSTLPPFCFQTSVQTVSTLCGKTSLENELIFDSSFSSVAVSWPQVTAVFTYFNNSGFPRILKKNAAVPELFLFESFPPQADGALKLAFNVTQPIVPLSALFTDFVGDRWVAAGCIDTNVGFLFRNSSDEEKLLTFSISIPANASKYKVESDSIGCLLLGAEFLVARYHVYYAAQKHSTQPIVYSSSLPVHQLMLLIDKYHEHSTEQKRLETDLADLGSQSRAVQKRLLIKLKDKKETSFDSLTTLLEDTHSSIMEITHRIESEQEALKMCSCELHPCLKLFFLLLKLSPYVSANDLKEFQAAVSSTFYLAENQNWLDVTDSALQYLLLYGFAKPSKAQACESLEIEPFQDINIFKQRFTTVITRLCRVTGSAQQVLEEQRAVSPIMENEEDSASEELSLMTQETLTIKTEKYLKPMAIQDKNEMDSFSKVSSSVM